MSECVLELMNHYLQTKKGTSQGREVLAEIKTHSAQTYLWKHQKESHGHVDNAKTAFRSFKIQTSSSCKELFYNFSAFLGKKNFTPLPSSSDIPQAFSEYFTNKIITITNRFPPVNPTVAMDKTTYSAKCYRHSHQSLNSLFWKFSKSLSPNHAILIPFPQKLLYENLDVLLSTITNIINTSLASGLVPPDFKTAIVKPLLKKPSLDQNVLKKLPSNLKPAISV